MVPNLNFMFSILCFACKCKQLAESLDSAALELLRESSVSLVGPHQGRRRHAIEEREGDAEDHAVEGQGCNGDDDAEDGAETKESGIANPIVVVAGLAHHKEAQEEAQREARDQDGNVREGESEICIHGFTFLLTFRICGLCRGGDLGRSQSSQVEVLRQEKRRFLSSL